MSSFARRRESIVRAGKSSRFARQAREVAARQVGLHFGPVRLGAGCIQDAEGHTAAGEPVAYVTTTNPEAIVSPLSMV